MRFSPLFALAFASLGTIASLAQPASSPKDALLIVAVSPASFQDGKETQIEVTVAYDLTSHDEAVINLGSNELRAQSFGSVAYTRVKRGSGTTTISGKLVPRYWTSNAPAKIAVHLMPTGDDSPIQRRALASDETRISVVRRAQPSESYRENPNPDVLYEDTISIKSISPGKLVEGQKTEIAVTISYELLSREEGQINLGYNRGAGNGYRIIGNTRIQIGSGETVLRANIVPARTGNLPFAKIFVNLSEYPHRKSWSPLAGDSHTIEVR